MSVVPTIEVYCDVADFGPDSASTLWSFNPIPYLLGLENAFSTDQWNLSSRVVKIHSKRGMFRPLQRVQDESFCEIDLLDTPTHSKDAPENPASTSLKIGRMIVIYGTDYSGRWLIYAGTIERIIPDVVSRVSKVVLHGFWRRGSRVSLPTMIGPTVAQAAQAVIDAAGFRGGLSAGVDTLSGLGRLPWWRVAEGTETEGGVGRMYIYGSPTDEIGGDTVLPYVLDQYINAPVETIIGDLVDAEVGYFYEQRSGVLTLRSRHESIKIPPFIGFTQSDMVDDDYAFGDGLINDIRMTIVPRKVVSGSVLWTSGEVLTFKEGTTYLTIRTLGADGRVVGLLETPTASNWNFTRASDGAATMCEIGVTQVGAGVIVEISNARAGERVNLAIGALLVGSALIKDAPMEIVEQDYQSSVIYGRRSMDFNLAMVDAPETAQAIARFFLTLWSRPAGSITHFDIQNDSVSNLHYMLVGEILDGLQITLASVYHEAVYLVKGLEHWFDLAAQKAICRVYVEPQRAGAFWLIEVVGYSEVGLTTRIGY